MTAKILAYITRQRGSETQLLVFGQVDFPEAGVQVPEGTVKSGEAIERAAQREVRGLVLEWASLHRDELRENWKRARAQEQVQPIAPLE